MRIRAVKEADIEKLEKMIEKIFESEYSDYPEKIINIQKQRYKKDELAKKIKRYDCWIGEVNGEVVGLICLDGDIIKKSFCKLRI